MKHCQPAENKACYWREPSTRACVALDCLFTDRHSLAALAVIVERQRQRDFNRGDKDLIPEGLSCAQRLPQGYDRFGDGPGSLLRFGHRPKGDHSPLRLILSQRSQRAAGQLERTFIVSAKQHVKPALQNQEFALPLCTSPFSPREDLLGRICVLLGQGHLAAQCQHPPLVDSQLCVRPHPLVGQRVQPTTDGQYPAGVYRLFGCQAD